MKFAKLEVWVEIPNSENVPMERRLQWLKTQVLGTLEQRFDPFGTKKNVRVQMPDQIIDKVGYGPY